MTRYLIVANQTLGGFELEHEVRRRIDRGEASFYVVVPMTRPELEAASWVPSDPLFGAPATTGPTSHAIEQARRRSGHRLSAMIGRIEELGGSADGEVGDHDPLRAAQEVLDREVFDEVIVSTLPAGLSRWIKMDLPSRLDRLVTCPVTTVEAEPTG